MRSSGKKTGIIYLYFLLFSICLFLAACTVLKTDPVRLIGAAFCHQIPTRSPEYNYPFCYRCNGLFFGIFWGGSISIFQKKEEKLFPIRKFIFLLAALLVFCLDILNSSKFGGIRLYPETVLYRMLSAYPLGFFLAQIIYSIPEKWLNTPRLNKISGISCNIILFASGIVLCRIFIFSHIYVLSLVSRILTGIACLLFTAFLYMILICCLAELRNRCINGRKVFLSGSGFALMQITVFGFLHLKFIHFEQFFH